MTTSEPSPSDTDQPSAVVEQPVVPASANNGGDNGAEASPTRADNRAPAPRAEGKEPRQRNRDRRKSGQRLVALFCHEPPDSPIGKYVGKLAAALARRQLAVHVFARQAFNLPGIAIHPVGDSSEADLVDGVTDFGKRAAEAFRTRIPSGSQVTLLGHEWSSIPAMVQLRLNDRVDSILLLRSLERQRSDMQSPLSQRIEEIERAGLRDAQAILVHDAATQEVARAALPECAARTACMKEAFPAHLFEQDLDPGSVKARYQIGPLDPLILYIGDFDSRHGPDVLMRSVPAILRNHPQSRFLFIGDGELFWPVRVHARYLLLEHAIRLPGSVSGQAIYDLVQAADIVVVPSREATEWWPVQAAWAAARPVVVSHPLGQAMQLHHEEDAVLVYPHESSCVWGIERLLFDPGLQAAMGRTGKEELEARFGFGGVVQQVCDLMGVPAARNA